MSSTSEIAKIVRKVASDKNYDMAENRRMIIHSEPNMNYQPDFFLINRNGICIIEMEITTDAIKGVIGDIIRSGLIGCSKFIGIVTNMQSKRLIEKYGIALSHSLQELRQMKVFCICYRGNRRSFERELSSIM